MRYRPPSSSRVIEVLVQAFDLDISGVPERTRRRYFRQDRVLRQGGDERTSAPRTREVLRVVTRAALRSGILPRLDPLEASGITTERGFAMALSSLAEIHDWVAGRIALHPYPIDFPQVPNGACLRLLVVDLAIRTAGVLGLAGRRLGEGHWGGGLPADGGDVLREFLAPLGDRRPSRDDIAASLDVSQNTVDAWFDRKVRPRRKHLEAIAARYGEDDPSKASARLSISYGLIELRAILDPHLPKECFDDCIAAFGRLVQWSTESLALKTWSDPVARDQSLSGLLLFGLFSPVEAPLARELITDLYVRESRDLWRGMLRRIRTDPIAYIRDACVVSGGIDEARRLAEISAGRPLNIPDVITPEWAQLLLGDRVARSGDVAAERAVPELKDKIGRDPGRPSFHFALGNWLAEIKQYERSIQEFWIAAELDREWDLPRARIGEILLAQEKELEASQHMESIAQGLTAKGDYFWLVLGETRRRVGDATGAVAALKQCLSMTPDHPQALECMARCHLELGDRVAARRYAKRARQFGESPTLKLLSEDGPARSSGNRPPRDRGGQRLKAE